MTPTPIRFAAAFVALLGAAAVIAIVAPRDGVGQEAKQVANAGTQAPGALHCIGCHGGPDTDQYRAYADRSELRTDFVRLDEQRTWKTNDLHSQAFLNIQPVETSATSGNLAWRIQESLRRSPTRDNK